MRYFPIFFFYGKGDEADFASDCTVKPGYTGHKKFVWAGQKKIGYIESSGILIPAKFC
jgi:hypothetical protein